MTVAIDDKVAIAEASVRFFVALDRFEDERLISLLHVDFEWLRPSGGLVGHDQVREMLSGRSRERITRHLVCNIDIEAGDKSAEVSVEVLVLQGPRDPSGAAGAAAPPTLISSRDTLRKEHGQWKITRKRPSLIFNEVALATGGAQP